MVIALSSFDCLCGFRKIPEIQEYMIQYPEFRDLLLSAGYTSESTSNLSDDLHIRAIFNALMRCDQSQVDQQVTNLVDRLMTISDLQPLDRLILKLHSEHGKDNGVFAPLVMNYLILQPGESFFIGANEPHAYLSGDCVECMALSDNVVRAGLTPKFKDVDTLCNMLTYRLSKPSYLEPKELNENVVVYRLVVS